MSNKLKLFVCLFVIFINTVSKAEIITTYSVNSSTVQKIEEWIDKDTIILIELDDTLIMPKSKMFSFDSNPYRMFLNNLITLGERSPAYTKAVANWYGQREVRLVEEGWIDFISRARAKGAKIYGICSMPLYLLNIEEKRLKEIKDLGIIFDSKLNNSEEFEIKKEFPWFARFHKGIIYNGPHSKHESILELFKIANLSPKKFLTFANVKYEIKLVDKALRKFNMYFKSVLYLGSREVTGRPNEEIVKFQQRQLIETGKWHEDDEASKLLNFRRQQENSGSAESQ